MNYKRLTDKDDDLLLLGFRQYYWDEWVEYCHSQGYESKVR